MRFIVMKRPSVFQGVTFLFLLVTFFDLSANDFSDADASQIVVTQMVKLESFVSKDPTRADDPRYSPDGRLLLYTKYDGEYYDGMMHGTSYGKKTPVPVLVIRDVKTRKIVDTFSGGFAAAWSPDGKRISYCGAGKNKLSIYELRSRKSVALDLTRKFTGCDAKYVWVNDRLIYTSWNEVIDLDSLKVTGFTGDDARNDAKKWFDSVVLSQHKRCHIYEYNFFVPEGPKGAVITGRKRVLIVENKDKSYTKVLSRDVVGRTQGGLELSGDKNYMVTGYDAAPDLTSVIFRKRDGLYIAYLGLGKPPATTFNIDSNFDSLKGTRSRDINRKLVDSHGEFFNRFKAGQLVRGTVFAAQKNPLNGNVIGPDRKNFKGYVKFVAMTEHSSVVRVITEYTPPIVNGDIVSNINVQQAYSGQGGISLDENVWMALKANATETK